MAGFASAGMSDRKSHLRSPCGGGLDEESIGTFDGMSAIKLGAHGINLRPTRELGVAEPKEHVVHEVRVGIAKAGIEHDSIAHHQASRPSCALKVV